MENIAFKFFPLPFLLFSNNLHSQNFEFFYFQNKIKSFNNLINFYKFISSKKSPKMWYLNNSIPALVFVSALLLPTIFYSAILIALLCCRCRKWFWDNNEDEDDDLVEQQMASTLGESRSL